MKIDPTPEEEAVWRLLLDMGRAFSEEAAQRNVNVALKGGSGLKLSLGLERPSTDLDFEGTMGNRGALGMARHAAKRMGERWENVRIWRKGWRWVLSPGTIEVSAREKATGRQVRTKIDYRAMGSRPGIPKEFEPNDTEMLSGIRIYKARPLVERKLHALIGPGARRAARDGFDAWWLRRHAPEHITAEEGLALDRWEQTVLPGGEQHEDWKGLAARDEVLGRHGWTAICSDRQSTLRAELIAEGQRQNQQRRHEQSRRSARERERTDRPEPQERPSTRNRGERER